MSPLIHPTAIVEDGADLASDVEVGPFSIVGSGAVVGKGSRIGARVTLLGSVRIGERCVIGVGSVLGGDPQDLKFDGSDTIVELGSDVRLGEYVTIHRGTQVTGKTTVGSGSFLMTYVHVAHDCEIEQDVTIANAVQLGGHVKVERGAQIGGITPIHQFVRIGAFAFVGGGSRVPQDIAPFSKVAGNPVRFFGMNSTGLERAGFSAPVQSAVKRALRMLFNSRMQMRDAVRMVDQELGEVPEVAQLLKFISESERGVTG